MTFIAFPSGGLPCHREETCFSKMQGGVPRPHSGMRGSWDWVRALPGLHCLLDGGSNSAGVEGTVPATHSLTCISEKVAVEVTSPLACAHLAPISWPARCRCDRVPRPSALSSAWVCSRPLYGHTGCALHKDTTVEGAPSTSQILVLCIFLRTIFWQMALACPAPITLLY